MDELPSYEASPASNHLPTPTSPKHQTSTYGTPEDDTDSASSAVLIEASGKDAQLVVSADRSLKNMLVDRMGVLETQANAHVFIQGEINVRVEGWETYNISLYNDEGVEPVQLKTRIDRISERSTKPTFRYGTDHEATAGSTSKRKLDDDAPFHLTEAAEGTPKRARVDSGEGEARLPETVLDGGRDKANSSIKPPSVTSRLQNVSAQIKWVEECRRIAEEAHDRREETWRLSSATFHDETRKDRERHEAWMVSEMAWQRNTLVGMMKDLKGLYPLGHSLK
jgi:hypothetical protein